MSQPKKRGRAHSQTASHAINLHRVFLRPVSPAEQRDQASSASTSATPLPASPSSYHHQYSMASSSSSPLPSPSTTPTPGNSTSPFSHAHSSFTRFLRKRAGLRNALFLLLFAGTFAALWALVQPKEVDLAGYYASRGGREGYTPQRPGIRTSASGGGGAGGRPPERDREDQDPFRHSHPNADAPPPPPSPPSPAAEPTEPEPPAPDFPPLAPDDPKHYTFPPIESERPKEIDLRWWLDNGATWFLDPIPALVSAPPPSTFTCTNDPSFGPLLLIAVFSTAKSWEKRDLIRVLGRSGLGPDIEKEVQFRFVVGRTEDAEWEKRLELEMERYGDIVRLEFPENMDEGKTYQFFRWVGERVGGERPRFAMKTDDDTFLVLPNLLKLISSLDCSQNIYFGTSWGACITNCYPFYMRGMAYGLSWPLIRWLTEANLPFEDYRQTEDARTGSWFLSLPRTEKMYVLDLERRLGDWDGVSIPVNSGTVALHAMKSNWLWVEVGLQLMKAWEREGKEYIFTREPREGANNRRRSIEAEAS